MQKRNQKIIEAYIAGHDGWCELAPYFPPADQKSVYVPLAGRRIEISKRNSVATETHHIFAGNQRIDAPWNLTRVCHWVHVWHTENRTDGRIVALWHKVSTNAFDREAAAKFLRYDPIEHVCAFEPQAAWIEPYWELLKERI